MVKSTIISLINWLACPGGTIIEIVIWAEFIKFGDFEVTQWGWTHLLEWVMTYGQQWELV